ncbi:unnamed protein product, partial [Ectocarpus fasciculatus]
YVRNLETRPVLTKCVTSAAISAGADATCQYLESTKKKFDFARFGKFTLLGMVLVGPTLHYWYGYLARNFAENSMLNVLKRLALDQLVFTPGFITVFMSSVLVLDGRPENIPEKLSSDFFTTLMANYSVWVPAMFLNFKFIPFQFQVLFSNGVGYMWNVYLSYASHKKVENKARR